MTYSLDLLFLSSKGDEFPAPPIANIYVKTSTQMDYGGKTKGWDFITPECVSLEEMEYEIDRLLKELEDIRRKARRKFAKEKG